MHSRKSLMWVCVLAGSIAASTLMSACSETTAPPRTVRAPSAALRDDDPPNTPCRSGWIIVDGRWSCQDPG